MLMAVGIVLFTPWIANRPLAQILRNSIGGFFEATLLALSLV